MCVCRSPDQGQSTWAVTFADLLYTELKDVTETEDDSPSMAHKAYITLWNAAVPLDKVSQQHVITDDIVACVRLRTAALRLLSQSDKESSCLLDRTKITLTRAEYSIPGRPDPDSVMCQRKTLVLDVIQSMMTDIQQTLTPRLSDSRLPTLVQLFVTHMEFLSCTGCGTQALSVVTTMEQRVSHASDDSDRLLLSMLCTIGVYAAHTVTDHTDKELMLTEDMLTTWGDTLSNTITHISPQSGCHQLHCATPAVLFCVTQYDKLVKWRSQTSHRGGDNVSVVTLCQLSAVLETVLTTVIQGGAVVDSKQQLTQTAAKLQVTTLQAVIVELQHSKGGLPWLQNSNGGLPWLQHYRGGFRKTWLPVQHSKHGKGGLPWLQLGSSLWHR